MVRSWFSSWAGRIPEQDPQEQRRVGWTRQEVMELSLKKACFWKPKVTLDTSDGSCALVTIIYITGPVLTIWLYETNVKCQIQPIILLWRERGRGSYGLNDTICLYIDILGGFLLNFCKDTDQDWSKDGRNQPALLYQRCVKIVWQQNCKQNKLISPSNFIWCGRK